MNLLTPSSGGRRNRGCSSRSFPLAASLMVALLAAAGSSAARAQEVISHADSMIYAAIEQIDSGRLKQAWETLREGERRYPENTTFPYEMAYIHYLEKNYAEARQVLLSIIDAPDVSDRYYQLLGNAHDMLGNPTLAIATYEKGMERFPDSGPLHLERGIMAFNVGNIPEATGFWERGIARAPQFPSNYFHMAHMYMGTENPGWGLIYGEIFLNLEGDTPRSGLLRSLIWETWNNVIKVKPRDGELVEGSVGRIDIFKDVVAVYNPETKQTLYPFELFIQKALSVATIPMMLSGSDKLTIARLHEIRKRFLTEWFKDEAASRHFAVELFERQRKLEELGLLETYDHLIFMSAQTQDEAEEWIEGHPKKIEALSEWIYANPIASNPYTAFARVRVKGMALSKSPVAE